MKAFLKAVLPASLIRKARGYRNRLRRQRLHSQYLAAKAAITPRQAAFPPRKALIIPSDAWSLTGALGDDAMITTAAQTFRRLNPAVSVGLLCYRGLSDALIKDGIHPVQFPKDNTFVPDVVSLLKTGKYDAVAILGADILDGYYGVDLVQKVLIIADLAASSGVETIFLGFSFNDRPDPELKPYFDGMHPAAKLNLRDEISFERFKRFTTAKPILVADSAFMLEPAPVDAETAAWIAAQKAAGRTIVGFNAHPMLIKSASEEQIARFIDRSVDAIRETSRGRDIAWLLVPHDYRAKHGDDVCLRPIYERLQAAGEGLTVRYFEGRHRAATLKGLAGLLDGVVTGRMHLAIAALGMRVPTLCLTYQDKFEGLFRHIGLPGDLLLPPQKLMEPDGLASVLASFVDKLPELKAIVESTHPHVMALSAKNFPEARDGEALPPSQ